MADSQVRLADQQEDKEQRGTEGSRSIAEILEDTAEATGATPVTQQQAKGQVAIQCKWRALMEQPANRCQQ